MVVKIADGGAISCTGIIPSCAWEVQGHAFVTDLQVLSLGWHDMIVGMDWLQACGPMWVDWAAKQLQFRHDGGLITLSAEQVGTSEKHLLRAVTDVRRQGCHLACIAAPESWS